MFTLGRFKQQIRVYKKKRKTLKRKLEALITKEELNINQGWPFEKQVDQLLQKSVALIETGGVKSRMQTYDMMDSETYFGLQEIRQQILD